jgi:hypothetical protein
MRFLRETGRSIFKPSGTLGDSENTTKIRVFSSQVEHLATRKIRRKSEYFQAKWNTWRLGKYDENQSIFKPSGTLGDSENTTKKALVWFP